MSWAMSLFDFATYQVLLIFDNVNFALHALNVIQMMQIITVMVLVKRYEHPIEIKDKEEIRR